MKWLKEEITFNRKEFLGISALMSIGLVALVFQFAPKQKEQVYDIRIDDILLEESKVEYEAPKTKRKVKVITKKKTKSYKQKEKQKTQTFEKFSFDPNTVGKDSLMRLGFKKRTAETWIKFRSKGKKFESENDLLSIYGIDSNLVSRLDQFLIFPRKEKKIDIFAEAETKYKTKVTKVPAQKIDLNTCTEEDLRALGGIGQIFASRILKYRSLLGGYAHKEQLLEVYGLTDSTFQVIKNFVEISSPPDLINVNTASKKQLSDHFLLDYKSAKLIYAYRKEHGPFVDSIDFQSIKGIPEPKKKEIIPYLSFAL